MHLFLPFAAPLAETARAALPMLVLPMLERLLAGWGVVQRDAGDDDSLSMPHERTWAAALGWRAPDGALPWAARHAALDGLDVGTSAWGELTPVHWRIGSDGVHLVDPGALALSEADSRALLAAVQPLFASEGYTLLWGAPLRWYAAHPSLQGLATASIERAIGRNIERWLPRNAAGKGLRRLQNEVQMLLHDHPLNDAREAAGAPPVNSFWLSGCGVPQAAQANDVQVDARLRGPALQGDWAAWCAAWQALDADTLAPLLTTAARNEPVRLTLCGERSSVTLAPQARPWWRRMVESLSTAPQRARPLLESL
jgi:hypothetical protein